MNRLITEDLAEEEDEMSVWLTICAMVWDSPLDLHVKVSTSVSLRRVTEMVFCAPTEQAVEPLVEPLRAAL